MLDRRSLLVTLAAAGLLPGQANAAPAESAESQRLHALFDAFVQAQMQRSPELATSLGLDKGKLAKLKSRLSDASLAASAQDRRDNAAHLKALLAIDRSKLHGIDVSSYDTVLFTLQVMVDGNKAIPYAGGDVHSPYVVSQLAGAYHDIPDFLDTQHDIQTEADAAEGGITGVLGRNGGGKTTTLRAILGLVPRTGSVELAGREIGAGGITGAARESSGVERRFSGARHRDLHGRDHPGTATAGRSFHPGAQECGA